MATRHGTRNADNLNGTSGQDYMFGYAGNDRMVGFGGDDYLFGHAGNDVLSGYDGSDSLFGGDGNDHVSGGNHDDFLDGGRGRDQAFGGNGNDLLHGRAGNDLLDGGAGDDELSGHDGSDRLYGKEGADRLYGGNHDDLLYGGEGDDELFGGSGNDTLDPGHGRNVLHAGSGDDLILFDVIGNTDALASGINRFDGGEGYDTLRIDNQGFVSNPEYPEYSDEPVFYSYTLFWGEDFPYFEYDGFMIVVGTTADTIEDTSGPTLIFESIERLEVNGDENHRLLYSGSRLDLTVVGGDADDLLGSGSGNEILVGGNGDDRYALYDYVGNYDNDIIRILDGTTGNDRASGFSERDRLEFVDMEPGEVSMSVVGDDTVFDWGEGTITLLGYHAVADDWLIA